MTTPHGLLQYSSGAFSDQVPADDSTEEHGDKDHAMLAPFTAAWQTAISPPLVIERSEGCYIYDVNGTKYLDALAGLLSTALGGSEPRLVKAATEQLNKLPFYHSFWNHTTRPSLDLAKELISMFTAREMGKVFFTNSGSEANDSQVKIVWYYNNALGRPKKKNIISRTQSVTVAGCTYAVRFGVPTRSEPFVPPITSPGYRLLAVFPSQEILRRVVSTV